jgi:hypothetical protein
VIRAPLVLLAVVVAACAASRPATRYEVWNWSIAIPDDLGVRPVNNADEIWRDGPLFITADDGSARIVGVRVTPLDEDGGDAETAVELLEAVAAEADSEEIGPVTGRHFPAGDGAVVHAIRLGLALDVVYIVARGHLIIVTTSEMTPADVLFIADSFEFRDPPGDPLDPPSNAPGSSASPAS